MKKLIRKIGICLLLLSLVLPLNAGAVSSSVATEIIDADKTCSLSLHFAYDGVPLTEEAVKVYRVAAVDTAYHFTAEPEFAACELDLNDITTSTEWEVATAALTAYVAASEIAPAAVEQTDENGDVLFAGLSVGLYYVPAIRRDLSDANYTYEDGLFFLPMPEENGDLSYDVSARPKGSRYVPSPNMIDYHIELHWDDPGYEGVRPESITIRILRNGEEWEIVELNDDNNWTFSWSAEDDGSVWTAVQAGLPDEYSAVFEKQGNNFIFVDSIRGAEEEKIIAPRTEDEASPLFWLLCIGTCGTATCVLLKKRKCID